MAAIYIVAQRCAMLEQAKDWDNRLRYTALQDLLSKRTGLFIAPERFEHLASCLRAGSRDLGILDVDNYISILQENPPTHLAWQRLLHHLTIGETYFFRDIDAIRDNHLPRIIQQRRQDGSRTLRIWSAGCATGEEP
jgi:chemotaxis protein methyltransferase CheR